MKQFIQQFDIPTEGQGLYEITEEVAHHLKASGLRDGLCTVFCRHTSCSLIINENADPDVRVDLEAFLKRLVPDGDPSFIHTLEGPDDMAAHIKTALTSVSLGIPFSAGRLALGTWQGLYLFEHRLQPHRRSVAVHMLGE